MKLYFAEAFYEILNTETNRSQRIDRVHQSFGATGHSVIFPSRSCRGSCPFTCAVDRHLGHCIFHRRSDTVCYAGGTYRSLYLFFFWRVDCRKNQSGIGLTLRWADIADAVVSALCRLSLRFALAFCGFRNSHVLGLARNCHGRFSHRRLSRRGREKKQEKKKQKLIYHFDINGKDSKNAFHISF